jgi:hypothetical protein
VGLQHCNHRIALFARHCPVDVRHACHQPTGKAQFAHVRVGNGQVGGAIAQPLAHQIVDPVPDEVLECVLTVGRARDSR